MLLKKKPKPLNRSSSQEFAEMKKELASFQSEAGGDVSGLGRRI